MFCPRCGTRNPDGTPHCTLCGAGLEPGALAVDPASLHAPAHTPPAPAAPVYGGFWRRAVALVLDSLVLFFPLATIRVLFGVDMMGEWVPESTSWWITSWAEVVIAWLYAGLMIAGPGRGTLGLQVMDLRVTGLHGQRVSFGRATGRYLAQCLTLLSLGVGYLMQVFTPRRQTLHDLVTATIVVRARPEPAPVPAPWSGTR